MSELRPKAKTVWQARGGDWAKDTLDSDLSGVGQDPWQVRGEWLEVR